MESKTYLGRYRVTLDQYEQPIRLRRDGSSVIYKAFDAESSREVALEVIPAGKIRISVQSQLEHEAEAAKALQQINVPMLYDFGIENNELIYATELVDGVTAEEWVTTHGAMPMGPALRIASQVVKALGAATFHGIFHHALNPAKIMIVPGQTTEGEWPLIKVMNFVGLAPNYARDDAAEAAVTDKINFVAPEQLESGTANFASEIYSLGCTLWFLLTGVPPLAGAATVESATRVPSPVRRLVSQMLATDPAQRPADPVALHEQIEDCIAEVENKRVIAPPPKAAVVAPVAIVEPRMRRPFPWQPLAVAAVLLLLGALAAMVLPARVRAWTGHGDIGVPVGVPDKVAAAASTESAAVPQPNETSPTPAIASNGVLVSTANADGNTDADASESEPEATAAAPQQAKQVASSEPAPTAEPEPSAEATAAPMLASNSRPQTPEVEPPSEGPTAEAATPPPPAETTPEPVAPTAAPEIVRNEPPVPTHVEREATRAPKPVRSALREKRAVVSTHRDRNGNVRAQFLGTTPDGELVFGLPSDQRAYLDPNGRRNARPQRRRHLEVRRAEPPDGLPVLPALPPDQ